MSCLGVELSADKEGGLNRSARSFMKATQCWDWFNGEWQPARAPHEEIQVVVYAVAYTVKPELIEGLSLHKTQHKRIVYTVNSPHGDLLLVANACSSSRDAFYLYCENFERKKRKRWYGYHGGGAVSPDQTELLQSVLVVTKDHS